MFPALARTSKSRKHHFYQGLLENLFNARKLGGTAVALSRGPLMEFDIQRVRGFCMCAHGQAAAAGGGLQEGSAA